MTQRPYNKALDSHKNMTSRLSSLKSTHVNSMSTYEPVGTIVLLYLNNNEILRAYRKSAVETRESKSVYYCERDGEIIKDEAWGWSYC